MTPRHVYRVMAAAYGGLQMTTGDYNRATRFARDLAVECKVAVTVCDEEGDVYTVSRHGKTQTLRDPRLQTASGERVRRQYDDQD